MKLSHNTNKNLIILALVIITPFLSFAMTTPNVTVSSDETNHYGQYTISARIGLGRRVEAHTDSLVVIFNDSTVLPQNIDPSYITVNEVSSCGVLISGQRLAIESPVEIVWFIGDPNFEIVISAAAKVRNPASSGNYTLAVETVELGGKIIESATTSNAYSIITSTSTISIPAVAPSPTVAGQAAAYNIAFNVGSGGYLVAGSSTITVGFDPSTTIQNGSLSGVTVNSTTATAVASDDTVVITSPVDVDNDGSIILNFALGSGIINPSTGGFYYLSIKTSSEDTFITSDSFAIANQGDFSISAVNLNPDIINTNSEYGLEFITSSSGALTASVDTIVIVFQPNTSLPSALSNADIMVSSGGFSDIAAGVNVQNVNQLNADTLFIITPINVGNSSTVNVTIKNSAGVLNPSEAGNYTLAMRTSQDVSLVNSNPYQVVSSSTTVSQANVIPASTSTLAVTSYEVDFNLGSKGRLHPGLSEITLTFDSEYTLATDKSRYDTTRISVGESAFVTIDTSLISPDDGNKTVDITIPSDVVTVNSDNIVLILDGKTTDPITNPGVDDTYTLGVKTSVEPTQVYSATYAIGGDSVEFISMTISDSTVNSIAQYTFEFDIDQRLRPVLNDYVKIVFPEGTELPSSISTLNVTINGNNPSSVSVVQSTRTVTAVVSMTIPPIFDVTVDFSTGAGIVNPAVPSASFYKANISTNREIIPVETRIYSITGGNTPVSSVSATANPSVKNVSNVAYTIDFTTSATGKLVGGAVAGSSTITVDFDTVTVVPSSINAASVKVNSMVAQLAEVLSSGNGGMVRLTIPEGLTIGNSSSVTVNFETGAGLNTRDFSGTFNMRVRTTSDTVYSDTTGTAGDYIITDTQNLSVTSVTSNPTTQNAAAGYSIKFSTGSSGALSAGDSIRITFPSNTSLPTVISLSDVTVNGTNPLSNPRISANTLIIPAPENIAALTSVTVLINQSANILNPTLVQSYTLEVATDIEPGPFTSPTYNITQTSTTVSVADVTVNPPSLSTGASYMLDFSVGGNGRLIAGTSTITITFNGSTTVNDTPANYDSTYIVVDGSSTQIPTNNIAVNSQAVTMTIPNGVSIDNLDNITLIVNGIGGTKPITNPGTSGSYTLQVHSSVETSNVTSNIYTISSAQPVSNVSMTLFPDIVNASSTDTVSFRAQNALSGGSGTVTIKFPLNTFIPSSIQNSSIQVANGSTNPDNFTDVDGVSVNTSTRTVGITVPSDISANDSVRVAFLTSSGLENPSIYGDYTAHVKTSSQPLEATSTAYSLQQTSTSITNLTVDITPNTPSQFAQFDYSFITGSRGRLVSGNSTVTLIFPNDVAFTQGVPPTSKVTVNSTPANALDLRLGSDQDPDTLLVTVPSSVTIGNNSEVTVVVNSTAGVRNASTTTPLTYQACTSVETTLEGSDIALPVELSVFQVETVGGFVKLRWVTESELNNDYWIIHRKELTLDEYENIRNGTLNIHDSQRPFLFIARLPGQGTFNMQTEYTYVDSSVAAGMVYAYRLADVSYSGQITYHDIQYAEIKLPETFQLNQNFPNPFNPTTTISYSIPVKSKVELKIYNILGQDVIELVNGTHEPGLYNIEWNGLNRYDQRVASGIYVYTITAKARNGEQQYKQVRKMVLIK